MSEKLLQISFSNKDRKPTLLAKYMNTMFKGKKLEIISARTNMFDFTNKGMKTSKPFGRS